MQDLDSFEKQASEPDETDQQALWLRGGSLFSLSLSGGTVANLYILCLSQIFPSLLNFMQLLCRCTEDAYK
jgi:hypothetical protein